MTNLKEITERLFATNDSGLRPCPWCGGNAEIKRRGGGRQSTQYECQHCGAFLETAECVYLGGQWNTRDADDCIREYQRREELQNSALVEAAEILANFKSNEPDSSATDLDRVKRKLEEWQACYAKLFTQLTETVQRAQRREAVLLEALNDIASWGEGETVNGGFDEPCSAKTARQALEQMEGVMTTDRTITAIHHIAEDKAKIEGLYTTNRGGAFRTVYRLEDGVEVEITTDDLRKLAREKLAQTEGKGDAVS